MSRCLLFSVLALLASCRAPDDPLHPGAACGLPPIPTDRAQEGIAELTVGRYDLTDTDDQRGWLFVPGELVYLFTEHRRYRITPTGEIVDVVPYPGEQTLLAIARGDRHWGAHMIDDQASWFCVLDDLGNVDATRCTALAASQVAIAFDGVVYRVFDATDGEIRRRRFDANGVLIDESTFAGATTYRVLDAIHADGVDIVVASDIDPCPRRRVYSLGDDAPVEVLDLLPSAAGVASDPLIDTSSGTLALVMGAHCLDGCDAVGDPTWMVGFVRDDGLVIDAIPAALRGQPSATWLDGNKVVVMSVEPDTVYENDVDSLTTSRLAFNRLLASGALEQPRLPFLDGVATNELVVVDGITLAPGEYFALVRWDGELQLLRMSSP